MTRTMGDAIHDQVPALHAAGTQMVAGYVTGSPDILWTPADWAMFPGIPHVTIDQGFTGSPVASADVLDVEAGAWTPQNAVAFRPQMTSPRPTAYASLSTLPQLDTAGWQGDVWVADWTGSPPGSTPPVPAGMNCVAVQWTNQGGGGAYDLSVVFDPAWPEENMAGATALQDGWSFCNKCAGLWYSGGATSGGVCPAGGQHTGVTFDYSMLHA